jgi:hypothetical protein
MNAYSTLYFLLLLVTFFSYSKSSEKKEYYSKMVRLLMLLWLATSVIAISLIRYAGLKNNLFVFHISTPLEYMILSMLYRDVIANKALKKSILFTIPVFIVLSILIAFFIQKWDTNNSYMIIIESVVMIFLSLFFLRETLLLQQVTVLNHFPMFWISVGILFYFTGSLVIEGMLNYIMRHSMELAKRTYRLGYIFEYLLFILFIIGAFCSKASSFSAGKRIQ